jgi:hypothetical protein
MASTAWKALCSVNLTIWLLLAIALNLAVGSRFAGHLPLVYGRLNDLRFQDWLLMNGPGTSWWVWSLFFLLLLFGVNTAACTADRLLYLVKKRSDYRFGPFTVLAAPSVMHLCFLLIIGSHALSQFGADILTAPAAKNSAVDLPEAASVSVNGVKCDFRTDPGLRGHVKSCAAFLTLRTPAGVTNRDVGILEPVMWNGYSIHLVPKGKSRPGELPVLELVIKHDPGLLPIVMGNAVLCLLMLWYFPIIKNRNGGNQ